MAELSSIHFIDMTPETAEHQCYHNSRENPPKYLVSGTFECSVNAENAWQEAQKIVENAKKTYAEKNKYQNGRPRPFIAKNFYKSAVVNIKAETTMQDLKNLAEKLEKKYKIQCYQIAIHKDEGNPKDPNDRNLHAHLEFITLDRETGKNSWRNLGVAKNLYNPKMREMQDLVAQELQMKRGEFKTLTKAKHIKPRLIALEYEKAEKRVQEQGLVLMNKKEIKALKEVIRQEFIAEKGHDSGDYKILRELDGDFENPKQLREVLEIALKAKKEREKNKDKEITELRSKLENNPQNSEIVNLWKNENDELRQGYNKVSLEKMEYRQKYEKEKEEKDKLEKENQVLKENIAQNDKNGSNLAENQKIDKLQAENEKLLKNAENDKKEIQKLKEQNTELNRNLEIVKAENNELKAENSHLKAIFKAFADKLKGGRWKEPLKFIASKIKNLLEFDKNTHLEITQKLENYDKLNEKPSQTQIKSQNQGFSR